MRQVEIAVLDNEKSPFADWFKSLDKSARKRIEIRLNRICENNFGDCKKIEPEISELRLKFGSGYRIYYNEIDEMTVLLLNGGDKSTQTKDINNAKKILYEWRQINEKI
ncbi:MAG: type II toxin-antitoxin system RelE/ParE family toxin [Heliobacteriaceae bacterium]|jgi:putative addiction module killer protein|nr:type II toxin-antitoxin system RelE/ParE family toxin [Heliobacteriaceae bacterium]